MKTISDTEYDEYLNLKKWEKKQKIRESAKLITKLEDDIDTPIRKCVAMFALLGCMPLYSCCGFDYDGQPYHKSHQYGRPYIILTMNSVTSQFMYELSNIKSLWYVSKGSSHDWCNLELMCGMNPHWRKEECIHFYEESLIGILHLENILLRCQSNMQDSVEIVDTNYLAKNQAKHWQYTPKESWIVSKYKLDTY